MALTFVSPLTEQGCFYLLSSVTKLTIVIISHAHTVPSFLRAMVRIPAGNGSYIRKSAYLNRGGSICYRPITKLTIAIISPRPYCPVVLEGSGMKFHRQWRLHSLVRLPEQGVSLRCRPVTEFTKELLPHAHTVPSFLRAMVCQSPPAMAITFVSPLT